MTTEAGRERPTLKMIATPGAPTPRGHYSQAVVAAGFVHVAGLLPMLAGSGALAGPDPAVQADQVLRNLDAILLAAGTDRTRVVSIQVFVTDGALWPIVNEACAAYFAAHRPARIIVPIGPLRDGALLELNAVALA